MKKSLLIAGLSSLVVLAGCGPTKTETSVVTTSGNTAVVASGVVVSSLTSGTTVVTETTNTATGTQTNTVVVSGNVSSMSNSVASVAVAPTPVSSAAVVVNSSAMNITESMAIINNTKFSEPNCEKIKTFMGCSIKAITGENQVLAANQMALQLKEMVADSNRGQKCDSQYNMLKSSPELANFEQQVNCKLQ